MPILGFLDLSDVDRVRSRHATDRQTYIQTVTGPHFIMPPRYGGRVHNNQNKNNNGQKRLTAIADLRWTVNVHSVKQKNTYMGREAEMLHRA